MHVFGITGGIASGKSLVSARFRQLGVPIVDADEVSRRVVLPGTDGLVAIVAAFGREVLDADGSLDRKRLGARIFGDDAARRTLNAILHPLIAERTAAELATLAESGTVLAGYDAALLVESGSYEMFRPLVVVTASPELQVARTMARDGFTRAEAEARLAAQMPLAQKAAVADFVLTNEADVPALEAEVDAVLARICDRVGVDARPLRRV